MIFYRYTTCTVTADVTNYYNFCILLLQALIEKVWRLTRPWVTDSMGVSIWELKNSCEHGDFFQNCKLLLVYGQFLSNNLTGAVTLYKNMVLIRGKMIEAGRDLKLLHYSELWYRRYRLYFIGKGNRRLNNYESIAWRVGRLCFAWLVNNLKQFGRHGWELRIKIKFKGCLKTTQVAFIYISLCFPHLHTGMGNFKNKRKRVNYLKMRAGKPSTIEKTCHMA